MANAGRHSDTVLLKKMIKYGLVLKINEGDHPVIVNIKIRFNNVVLNDYAENRSYNGRKYIWHSAWNKCDSVVMRVNQIRQKNWQFAPINTLDLTKAN